MPSQASFYLCVGMDLREITSLVFDMRHCFHLSALLYVVLLLHPMNVTLPTSNKLNVPKKCYFLGPSSVSNMLTSYQTFLVEK